MEGLRALCEAERRFDSLLAGLSYRRRYFAQKGQDRWVIQRALPAKKGGYFVDVGAGDGRTHSNTYSLERDFGWSGVLIEPNPAYAPSLRRLRRSQIIQKAAGRSTEVRSFLPLGYLGGFSDGDGDYSSPVRARVLTRYAARIITVETEALGTLLERVKAPCNIDFLSIDVEGSEEAVISGLPFDQYHFQAITVERPTASIHRILTAEGYVLDQVKLFDGFYVSADIARRLGLPREKAPNVQAKAF